MIELLLLAPILLRTGEYEPPPELFYHQAVSCATTLKMAVPKDPSPIELAELMTWGMIMADTGRKAGRTRDQVDHVDLQIAEGFYKRLKEKKPKAITAQRAYCKALLDADRP
ncbi:MAG: hypothetical protein ABIW83_05575 [Allosphingosinicella sp.]